MVSIGRVFRLTYIWRPGALALLVVLLYGLVFWRDVLWAAAVLEEAVYGAAGLTAERAAVFGARHLDAETPVLYDIERSRYFYAKSATLDPTYPYVQHQLARIAFLEGDYNVALWRINREFAVNPNPHPSSQYVRGLIYGYMGQYGNSIEGFRAYLEADPTNWAAVNDYAWVLLKAGRQEEALAAIEEVIALWPKNPWLLNSAAIAAYEVGEYERARGYAERAAEHVRGLTKREWLVAYPGNDPRIAGDGIAALKKSILNNMHTITSARDDSAVQ